MGSGGATLLDLAAERFSAALTDVASEVASTCRTEIPSYAALEAAGVVEEVEVAFSEHAHVLTRAIVDRRSLSPEELDALGQLGRRRFLQGLPLHDLVAGYQVGIRVALEHFLVHLKNIPFDAHEHALTANEVTRHTLKIAAQAASAISRAYLGAQRDAGRLPPDLDRDLSWLGQRRDPDRIDQCLRHLGFTPTANHVVFMLSVSGPDAVDDLQPLRGQLEVALRLHVSGLLFGRAGRRLVVVAGVSPEGAAVPWLSETVAALSTPGERVQAGIGDIVPGVEGIQRSYEQALEVMELLEEGSSLATVMTYQKALPYVVLRKCREESRMLIEGVLGPLRKDPSGERLLETLHAYFGCGSATAAAEVLRIHRQSLYERLLRIQSLTGLSIEDSDDRMRYQLALKALRALGEDEQPLSPR